MIFTFLPLLFFLQLEVACASDIEASRVMHNIVDPTEFFLDIGTARYDFTSNTKEAKLYLSLYVQKLGHSGSRFECIAIKKYDREEEEKLENIRASGIDDTMYRADCKGKSEKVRIAWKDISRSNRLFSKYHKMLLRVQVPGWNLLEELNDKTGAFYEVVLLFKNTSKEHEQWNLRRRSARTFKVVQNGDFEKDPIKRVSRWRGALTKGIRKGQSSQESEEAANANADADADAEGNADAAAAVDQ